MKTAAVLYCLGALLVPALFVVALHNLDLWVAVFGGAGLALFIGSAAAVVRSTTPETIG